MFFLFSWKKFTAARGQCNFPWLNFTGSLFDLNLHYELQLFVSASDESGIRSSNDDLFIHFLFWFGCLATKCSSLVTFAKKWDSNKKQRLIKKHFLKWIQNFWSEHSKDSKLNEVNRVYVRQGEKTVFYSRFLLSFFSLLSIFFFLRFMYHAGSFSVCDRFG